MPSPSETRRLIEREIANHLVFGSIFYVDPANGANTNSGRSINSAKATLAAALALCTAGKNDTVFLIGNGASSGSARPTETLVWSKNATNLIGITAPTSIAQRARISTPAGQATNINPLIQVTADGCTFKNFSLFQGVGQAATAEQLWEDQGERNYYENIHFGGMGHANGAGQAASYCVSLNGGGEHRFKQCTFGLDTIVRSAANATLLVRSASARNVFEDCRFLSAGSAGTPHFVDVNAANSLGRFLHFRNCAFMNSLNISPGATAMDDVVDTHANQNGYVLMDQCLSVNCGDWGPTDGSLLLLANMVTTNGDTGGEAVNNDAT